MDLAFSGHRLRISYCHDTGEKASLILGYVRGALLIITLWEEVEDVLEVMAMYIFLPRFSLKSDISQQRLDGTHSVFISVCQ